MDISLDQHNVHECHSMNNGRICFALSWSWSDLIPMIIWLSHLGLSHCQLAWTLRTKNPSKHLFWCFILSQTWDSCQYLEGSISTWKDHNGNIGVSLESRSFRVVTQVPYLWQAETPKRCLEALFVLRVCMILHELSPCNHRKPLVADVVCPGLSTSETPCRTTPSNHNRHEPFM